MRKHLLKDLQDNASCQVKVDGNLSTTVAKVGVPICFSFILGQLSCLLLVLIPMFVQGEMWTKDTCCDQYWRRMLGMEWKGYFAEKDVNFYELF